MSRKPRGTQLNCFSPPVMVATMVIEIALAIYTVWRYKLNTVGRLVTAMLIALATFQFAEYHVCTGSGAPIPWSRLGFVAITTLPPLGLHLMYVLAKRSDRKVITVAYTSMLAFSTFFLITPTAFSGQECTGNYVIFQFTQHVTGVYTLYYFGWILAGLGLGWHWSGELRHRGQAAAKRLQAVQGLLAGYLIFLVPSALAMTIRPEARRGIPSVLCGFAVLLALVITLYVLPRAGERKA